MNNNMKKATRNALHGYWQVVFKLVQINPVLLYGLAILPCSIYAASSNVELPIGAVIEMGLATIDQSHATLNINQSSSSLISNWSSFNIGSEATVNFNQPSHAAVAINHILDNQASQIMGQLNANGQVFLLNPNGIIFSKTAQINVGGLVAATLQLSEMDIATGKFIFSGAVDSQAWIENQGNIRTSNAGVVAFIAANIKNSGTITTTNAASYLSAASQVTLVLQDGSLTQYQVEQGVLQGLIDNGGAIIADNGAVYLTAKAKDDLSKAVINHSGVIEANRVSQNAQGEIVLLAQGASSTVNVSGVLTAEGKNNQDGGWIETSAAQVNLIDGLHVSTLSDDAQNAQTGTWWINPYNVSIENTAQSNNININSTFTPTQNDSVINVSTLNTALANNNITVTTSAAEGTQLGDIYVNAPINWDAATALTLTADNNIHINADITASNANGKLNLQYGKTTTNTAATYDLNNAAQINLQAGNNFSTLKGPDINNTLQYTVITSLGSAGSTTAIDLQGISGDLSGNYALGTNIEAQASKSWNSGSGFNPIGSSSSPFTGNFDGLGHSISNLTIYRPSQFYAGLFAYISSATIQNLSLLGGSVLSGSYAGSLVGYNAAGQISHVDASTNVTANAASSSVYAGGIVGYNNAGSISDVYSTGKVYASSTNSFAYAGGLVAINYYAAISQSYATGSVAASSTYTNAAAGGLAGYNNNGSISEVYATGVVAASSVSSAPYAGGLVGYNNNGSINNAYATGTVASSSSNAKAYSGGLAGYNLTGTINASYATGQVSAGSSSSTALTGGLTSWNSGTVTDSFWDSQSTGQDSSAGGGTAATSIAMQDIGLYFDASWDIDDEGGTGKVWRIYDGFSLPLLRTFLTPVDLDYSDQTTSYNGQVQSLNLQLPPDLDEALLLIMPAVEAKNVGIYHYGYYSKQTGYDLINNAVSLSIEPAILRGGGLTQYGVSTRYGRVKFKNVVAADLDAQGAQTAGDFYIASLNLSRLQYIGKRSTQAYVGILAQYSPDNLDSAEQYLVGGPLNVRGYDSSQFSGSSGYFATVELRQTLFQSAKQQLVGKIFVDTAGLKINANPWVGLTEANYAQAHSAGLGFNWSHISGYQLQASVAFPFGSMPEQLTSRDSSQYWVSIQKSF